MSEIYIDIFSPRYTMWLEVLISCRIDVFSFGIIFEKPNPKIWYIGSVRVSLSLSLCAWVSDCIARWCEVREWTFSSLLKSKKRKTKTKIIDFTFCIQLQYVYTYMCVSSIGAKYTAIVFDKVALGLAYTDPNYFQAHAYTYVH